MTKPRYLGYCGYKAGDSVHFTPPVHLDDADDAWGYVDLHAHLFHEVRITDRMDFLVIHAVEGKLVFPTSEAIPQGFIDDFNQRHSAQQTDPT